MPWNYFAIYSLRPWGSLLRLWGRCGAGELAIPGGTRGWDEQIRRWIGSVTHFQTQNIARPRISYIVIKFPHPCAIFQREISEHVSLLKIDKVTNYQGTRALRSDIYTIPCPLVQIKQSNTHRTLAYRLLLSHSGKSKPFQSSVGCY